MGNALLSKNSDMSKYILLKSSYSFVKPTINSILQDISKYFCVSEGKKSEITIILGELILNSIEHGNNFNFSKNIKIEYSTSNHNLYLVVEDEGAGFNYKDKISNSNKYSGLNLVKALSHKVLWNSKGNRVYIQIKCS